MPKRILFTLIAGLLVTVLGLGAQAALAADPPYKVLVFSKTAGFRHDSIPVGIQMVRDLGAANNFTVDATEDAAAFTTANLAQYKVVIFLSTTGDVLNAAQQTAFESYIGSGGGYVGVHAAADTEYDWPFYGQLVGAWFASHPAIQQVTVRVDDQTHPSTTGLPAAWVRTDELYNYRTNPRGVARVLARLDESTYTGGSMGADHPITWCHPFQGGRAWYTGLGHTQQSYAEPLFRGHVLGGIRWAAGVAAGDCGGGGPTPTPTPTVTPNPGTTQAEAFTSQFGTQVVAKASARGGQAVGYIENGDWLGFSGVSTAGVTGFSARVASAGVGGTIQVRSGSATGTLLGSIAVAPTGGWENWATVSGTLTGTATGPLFLAFTGGAGSLFDIDEFTLVKGPTPTPTPTPSDPVPTVKLLSQGRPVTVSSTENAGTPGSAAVDGNAGTRWSSAFSDPQWISVDLGAPHPVSRVKLTWEAAYGKAYRIETSTDGTTWTPAYTTTASDGGVDDITLSTNVSARYVRVYGTQRATGYGYSLWELEVYGY
ncbi:sugar-binding protein [Sphaerisporangium album]|uniref:Sugar-binding protein n=1 Tax=Sphaerisporangium album TaxID=509200 RepID=A0A367F177_9ACTN|nr:ThuA domain-containing protein [Sphaerisporangium album]RCG24011.1 sugar-binding protein [Sphaerisporangium album]